MDVFYPPRVISNLIYTLTSHRHTDTSVTGVVLAGGRSSRFGQDKGLYPYHGKPLVLHAADIIRPLCDELLIISNTPEEYRILACR